jgi:hypothetical protein
VKTARVFLLVLAQAGCAATDDPLPELYGPPGAEPCSDPLPSPVVAFNSPTDPAHCLPEAMRAIETTVSVRVSADGRAVEVEDAPTLCLTVRSDGTIEPQNFLSSETKDCILRDLRTWRFAAGAPTCWPQSALVTLTTGHSRNGRVASSQTTAVCGG